MPSFYLAEMARQHVTVALNGDGGDESFAGYPRYVPNVLSQRLERLPDALRRAATAWRTAPADQREGRQRVESLAAAGERVRSRCRGPLHRLCVVPRRLHRDQLYTDEYRELRRRVSWRRR